MPLKSVDDILQPDPRSADLCIIERGVARRMTLADHHRAIASIDLSEAARTMSAPRSTALGTPSSTPFSTMTCLSSARCRLSVRSS